MDKNKWTVLLIDDDAAILDAAEMLLSSVGLTVYAAQGIQGSLDHLKQGVQPDILVCDYRMPEMNGPEVVRSIRAVLGSEIPVLMMTGDTSAEAILQTNIPKCEVLRKPFRVDYLLQRIESSLSETPSRAVRTPD